MMTRDQKKAVTEVFNKFFDSDVKNGQLNDTVTYWDGLDDYVLLLSELDDDQLHREADVIYEHHKVKHPKSSDAHPEKSAYMQTILEAVGAILELYKESGKLHKNNKYILQYYLALNQIGAIVS